jgi:hypothetical protein
MKKPNDIAQTSSKRIVEQPNNFVVNDKQRLIDLSVVCENFSQKVLLSSGPSGGLIKPAPLAFPSGQSWFQFLKSILIARPSISSVISTFSFG